MNKAAHALGNMKPAPLQAAEGGLWKAFMDISKGEEASIAIARFLAEYDIMHERWQDRADFVHDKKWFKLVCKCELLDLCLCFRPFSSS
jgi:hypothetical protein